MLRESANLNPVCGITNIRIFHRASGKFLHLPQANLQLILTGGISKPNERSGPRLEPRPHPIQHDVRRGDVNAVLKDLINPDSRRNL